MGWQEPAEADANDRNGSKVAAWAPVDFAVLHGIAALIALAVRSGCCLIAACPGRIAKNRLVTAKIGEDRGGPKALFRRSGSGD